MTELNGKTYTKEELLRYCSNMNQLASITESRLGNSRGGSLQNYQVVTGSGLEYTLLPSRCMDIAFMRYKGTNISFLAKPGVTAPGNYTDDFGRYMIGGMLFTCGLQNAGPGCVDVNGETQPVHGRIGITPAEHAYTKTYWQGDDFLLEAGGVMRESALFGTHLSLSRRITSRLGSSEITVEDTLENLTPEETEIMLLYHCNFGFPFLDEDTEIFFPENTITPRTEIAAEHVSESLRITKPQDGFKEHVFFRNAKADADGNVTITVQNKRLKIGVSLQYEQKNLPNLVQWKSMKSGDYALGIEPSNCFIKGRKDERKNGTIQTIAPFSKLEYRLKFTVYDL